MTEESDQHQDRLVKVASLRNRAGVGEQDKLLNEFAPEGWGLVDARRRCHVWNWSWDATDTFEFQRAASNGHAPAGGA